MLYKENINTKEKFSKEAAEKVKNLLKYELPKVEYLEKVTKRMDGVKAEVYTQDVEKLRKLFEIATKVNINEKRV